MPLAGIQAADVRIQCDRRRHRHARLRVALAVTVALFDRIEGRRWLSFASLHDYARGRLGISFGHFLRYQRLGCLLVQCPALHEAVLAGRVSFSVADRLALACDPEAASSMLPRLLGRTVRQSEAILEEHLVESERGTATEPMPPASERGTDPAYERVAFVVPAPVAQYLHQSMELACAQLGADVPASVAVDAIVAEASTEIAPTVGVAEARHRFQGRRRHRRASSHAPVRPPSIPRPRFRQGDRRAAAILDRRLLRLLEHLARQQTELQDFLLELQAQGAAQSCGYAAFADFTHDALDIPRSTLFDHLRRARQRRRGDPVAVAFAEGRLTAVKAQLLDQLARRGHVPWSCLEPWVQVAQRYTTRHVERMVRWALERRDLDYRAWSCADFAPPTEDQVRTWNRPLHEIAANPEPESILEAERAPQVTVPWTLQTETVDVLLQLMAAVQDGYWQQHLESPPPWVCLVGVFETARREWSVLERQPLNSQERVRRRDHYRCVVPHCTQRRHLEVHHIRFRSAQGSDEPSNLATFCAFHHRIATHEHGSLRVRGQATRDASDLIFELGRDALGRPREVYRGDLRLRG